MKNNKELITKEALDKWIYERYYSKAQFCKEFGIDKHQLARWYSTGTGLFKPSRDKIEANTPFTFEESEV